MFYRTRVYPMHQPKPEFAHLWNPISISGFIHHWIQSRHCRILSMCAIWCWSVEKCGHQSLKTAKIGIRTPLKSASYFRFVWQTIGVDAKTFLNRMQNLVKIGKEWLNVIPNRNQIRNLQVSKIRFLFPVSFTIEYKVSSSGLSHKQQATKRPDFWAACKIWWKLVKNCGTNN